MATVSMPHVIIKYADREEFEKRSRESETHLKQSLDMNSERGKVLRELLKKSSTTVVALTTWEDDDH